MKSFPSSTSIMSATETIGLVIEINAENGVAAQRRPAGPQRADVVPIGDFAAPGDHHGNAGHVAGIDLALHHGGKPRRAPAVVKPDLLWVGGNLRVQSGGMFVRMIVHGASSPVGKELKPCASPDFMQSR